MTLTRCPDAEAAARACARALAARLRDALAARGRADIALNGGSAPRPVYEQLPGLLADWSAVHLWWGDERCVAPGDEDANYRLAAETLIPGAGIPPERIHRMRGELGPDEGARAYAAELAQHLGRDDVSGMPVLDVAYLGLGPDGHTASLFPGHPQLEARDTAAVGVRDSPKPPPERISLSLPCLNAARSRVLHVVGEEKADALADALGPPSRDTPASLLAREGLEIVAEAAALVSIGDGGTA